MDVAERDEVDTIVSGGDGENEIIKLSPSKNLNGATDYLTPKARLTFTKLRKAFTKTPILQHFDLECHIQIETDVSS